MTIEEKAKAYDEALEKIREGLQPLPDGAKISGVTRAFLEEVFPELKESEDERIRKRLIDLIYKVYAFTNYITCVEYENIIAWLEKQGDCSAKWEKNTADNKPTLNHSVLMKNIHGIAEGEWNGKEWIQYRWSSNIEDSDVIYWMELSELEKQGKQKPFDYENANIQQKDFAPINVTDEGIVEAIKNTSVLDMIEQKQEWSEEDDYNLQCMIAKVTYDIQKGNVGRNNELIDWLKSLKDRVKGKED